jgi:outer membrane protein TolC
MLNSLLDRDTAAPLPEPARAELIEPSARIDALLAGAARQNPELARIRERIAADHERLRLARLQRVPDLTVRFDYSFLATTERTPNAGEQNASLIAGINLPIWTERLDAAEREARHTLLAGTDELRDASNRVAFRVRDAALRIEMRYRQALLLRDTIIPQARLSLEAGLSTYRGGQGDFAALLSSARGLLNDQVMYEQILTQLEQDEADLRVQLGEDVTPDATQPAGP